MKDEQVEKIIRSNMMLQMNLAGIRADFEEALQRTWVGLTADEMESLFQLATYMDDTDYIHMLMMAEDKLKEKNT